MFILKYLPILRVFYNRNFTKNALMVSFLLVTNLTVSVFLFFFSSSQTIMPVLNESYFETLSVNISRFNSVATNNELIKVRTYERPSLSFMNSVMTRTGRFDIRPDYSMFLSELTVSLYAKEVATPLVVTYMHNNQGIGINEAFYSLLSKEVTLSEEQLSLRLVLRKKFMIENLERILEHEDDVLINFIYEEPSYFSTPKLYIPESYLDATIGSYLVSEGLTLTNYLLNINTDNELANLSLRCHFNSLAQYNLFKDIVADISSDDYGYEITGDHLQKIASFAALYAYLEILIKILFIFVIVALIVILFVIAHTSLLSNMRQMALLNVLGAKRSDLYTFFFMLLSFNFILGLYSLLLLPPLLPLFSKLLFHLLRIDIALAINIHYLIMAMCLNYLFLIFVLTTIFMLNMRRPPLYLLIDA